jgi:hypothetical protein
MKLLAAYRLLVTAEGEWWDTLTDEMKKMYIEEHPDSKYAKGYGLGQPKQDTEQPGKPDEHVRKPGVPVKPVQRQFGPRDAQTQEALKTLPPAVKKFVSSGETKAGSKTRKKEADSVKAAAPSVARKVLKDVAGVASGLRSAHNVLQGKPKPGDAKKIASLVGTILGTSAMMAALGATGPVGFLAFMAVKHIAAPELANIVRRAIAPRDDGNDDPDEYGYYEPDGKGGRKWNPMTREEYHRTFDDPSFENRHGITDGKRPKKHDNRSDDMDYSRASVVTATDDEKLMTSLIQGIADYAANGDIPSDAWKAAIHEMAQKQAADQPARAEDEQ